MKAERFTLIQQSACVSALGRTCKVTNKVPCDEPYLRPPGTVIVDYSISGSKKVPTALKKNSMTLVFSLCMQYAFQQLCVHDGTAYRFTEQVVGGDRVINCAAVTPA